MLSFQKSGIIALTNGAIEFDEVFHTFIIALLALFVFLFFFLLLLIDIFEGTTFYISEPIDPKHGIGTKSDKFFLSRAKLAELTFTPAIGQEIEIFYNRYGKVCSLKLLNLDDIEID